MKKIGLFLLGTYVAIDLVVSSAVVGYYIGRHLAKEIDENGETTWFFRK